MLFLVEALQPLEMISVVNLAVVARFYEVLLAECQFHLSEQDFLEFLVDAFMGVDVIHSYTGLPAI